MTNTEASTTTQTAAVAEQGANVAPPKATSTKATSRKKGAPKAKAAAGTAARVAEMVSATNLSPAAAVAQVKAKASKPKTKKGTKPANAGKSAKAAKAKSEAATLRTGTAKARVIAMMQRKGGASLESIMKETGWQAHTCRGFISILGSKHGMKITSTKRESDGARVYSVD